MICPDAECIAPQIFILDLDGSLYRGSIWECEECGCFAFCAESKFEPSVEGVVDELLERPSHRN